MYRSGDNRAFSVARVLYYTLILDYYINMTIEETRDGKTIWKICAWCQTTIQDSPDKTEISHGICQRCAVQVMDTYRGDQMKKKLSKQEFAAQVDAAMNLQKEQDRRCPKRIDIGITWRVVDGDEDPEPEDWNERRFKSDKAADAFVKALSIDFEKRNVEWEWDYIYFNVY